MHPSWRHTEGTEPLEWKTWKPADERSSSHRPRSSANLSSCGFWLGSETLGSIRLKIVNNCAQFAHTRARTMHANQVKSSEVYFTSSGVASKQEKWDCNPNWTLFAEICAEERGDLRDVLVESGASSFSRATIVRDATVNPCGSNLLVKNRFGRRSLRVWFSQGVLSRIQRVWSP